MLQSSDAHLEPRCCGRPAFLTLAADTRLTSTDYNDDQIWELEPGRRRTGRADATTYGLRAHWLRLFPRFVRGENSRVDPASFHTPPRIVCFFPNYLSQTFAPFDGLEVEMEYWIPGSHRRRADQADQPQHPPPKFAPGMGGDCSNPIDRQGGMIPLAVGPTHRAQRRYVLSLPGGRPSGGPQPVNSPYPALSLDLGCIRAVRGAVSWVRRRAAHL